MNNNSSSSRDERNNEESEGSGFSWWTLGLGIAAAAAAGIYVASQKEQPQKHHSETDSDESDDESLDDVDLVVDDAVSRRAVSTPVVNNLSSLLNDIHVRYIAIKKEEFTLQYNVFENVFKRLHNSMKAVDPYYERYSSRLQFRSEKFSMHITIKLPVNINENSVNPEESDIVIQQKHSSLVQLRAGPQYMMLPRRADFDTNKQAFFWLDENKYILCSRFFSWFQSLVDRALNRFQRRVTVNGTKYVITTSSSGAAYTLWITNSGGFRLEVDLVPTLRFPEGRWLGRGKVYRGIPQNCNAGFWTVVPKANRFGVTSNEGHRSWQIDMFDQERKILHNSYHLRQGIRLLKKLRDTQKMEHIKNYHIKSLFMLKSVECPQSFWQRDVATIFKVMLGEFHDAIIDEKIPSFWNVSHNLLQNVPKYILTGYANKLQLLIRGLEIDGNYMIAAKYLLSDAQYAEYISMLNKFF